MYGFGVRVSMTFDDAILKVSQCLKEEGFGILSDIDVQATLKARLGVDRRPYRILGACNPSFARQAIEIDPDIGLLLPCNVLVREEDDGGVSVSFMDPIAVLGLVDHPDMPVIAAAVRDRLDRVRDGLSA